jgi:peptidoglycan/xylan/chitin deacetylase (PgdA/CDA1 family)
MSRPPLARVALWAYASAGVTIGAHSLFVAPPPVLPMVASLGGLFALGTAGVFWPERGMYGSLLWRGPKRPEVALTFDDGPNPHTTPIVLDALAEAGATATFFVVGRKAHTHPELVREIAARGHQLGLHGFEHDRLFSLRRAAHVLSDIRRTQAVLGDAGVTPPTLFRPPIGFVSHFTVTGARRAGVTLVGCSARAFDGFAHASVTKVTGRLLRALEPGALIAMHDSAERDDYTPASLAALPRVLEELERRSLRAVPLSSWT